MIDKITKYIRIRRKEELWLFTDWSFGMTRVDIYTSYSDQKLITSRIINDGEYTFWFNIDTVRDEIVKYAKENELNIKGLDETISDLYKEGFSFINKEYQETISKMVEKNKNGIKIKMIN